MNPVRSGVPFAWQDGLVSAMQAMEEADLPYGWTAQTTHGGTTKDLYQGRDLLAREGATCYCCGAVLEAVVRSLQSCGAWDRLQAGMGLRLKRAIFREAPYLRGLWSAFDVDPDLILALNEATGWTWMRGEGIEVLWGSVVQIESDKSVEYGAGHSMIGLGTVAGIPDYAPAAFLGWSANAYPPKIVSEEGPSYAYQGEKDKADGYGMDYWKGKAPRGFFFVVPLA